MLRPLGFSSGLSGLRVAPVSAPPIKTRRDEAEAPKTWTPKQKPTKNHGFPSVVPEVMRTQWPSAAAEQKSRSKRQGVREASTFLDLPSLPSPNS